MTHQRLEDVQSSCVKVGRKTTFFVKSSAVNAGLLDRVETWNVHDTIAVRFSLAWNHRGYIHDNRHARK
jgi:hypothetical protein